MVKGHSRIWAVPGSAPSQSVGVPVSRYYISWISQLLAPPTPIHCGHRKGDSNPTQCDIFSHLSPTRTRQPHLPRPQGTRPNVQCPGVPFLDDKSIISSINTRPHHLLFRHFTTDLLKCPDSCPNASEIANASLSAILPRHVKSI